MATKKTKDTKKNAKIYNLLTRSNDTITKDKAERITRAVSNSFQRKVLGYEEKIDKLVDKRERMLDMSASNVTTTKNAIDDLEADGFVEKFDELNQELFIAKRQLEIAKEGYEELLGEE